MRRCVHFPDLAYCLPRTPRALLPHPASRRGSAKLAVHTFSQTRPQIQSCFSSSLSSLLCSQPDRCVPQTTHRTALPPLKYFSLLLTTVNPTCSKCCLLPCHLPLSCFSSSSADASSSLTSTPTAPQHSGLALLPILSTGCSRRSQGLTAACVLVTSPALPLSPGF